MSAVDDVYARFHAVGAEVVAPSSAARDREVRFDRDVWRAVARAGLFTLVDPRERRAAVEGLAAGSLDLGFAVTAVAHLVFLEVLERHGSAAQKRAWLERARSGDVVGACANAEPGAGTDLMGLKSRARGSSGGWTLSARKRSITNIGAADVALVSARVTDVPAEKAVNVFLVDTRGERCRMRARTDLLGLRTSPTGTLLCRGAPLGADALVGALGGGLALFRFMFSSERIYTGALYLAAIRACLARSLGHAEKRLQFGAPIGRNQYVQEKIVQMRIAEELLAAHLERTHARFVDGDDVFGSLSIAKAYGIDAAIAAAQDLVRLLGARGLSTDDTPERLLRDLLALSILGGTVELQKIVIYNEAAKALHATSRRADPRPPARSPELRVVGIDDVDAALEKQLVDLVTRAFPDEKAVHGRWYYDTRPTFVVLAEDGGKVIGMRMVIERTTLLGNRDVKIGGIGIAVDPSHQRRGLGKALTARALAELDARGFDLAVAFLFSRNSEGLLRRAGFRGLTAKVTYLDRKTGALVAEEMPCFAKGLKSDAVVDEVEARRELHLGVGTW